VIIFIHHDFFICNLRFIVSTQVWCHKKLFSEILNFIMIGWLKINSYREARAHTAMPLLHSPYKPLVWKHFIDDDFHSTIKFTCETSPESVTFLDTTVYKGPYPTLHILDVKTYFKSTETFQYTHFSSCHPICVKKGFVKGEALTLLRNNSVAKALKTTNKPSPNTSKNLSLVFLKK